MTAVRAYEGILKLDTVPLTTPYLNLPLPDPTVHRVIAFYLPLGSPPPTLTAARILTKTFGTAPHRQFWVQWNSLATVNNQWQGGTQWWYSSIVLEETTNRIFMVYQRSVWWAAPRAGRMTFSPNMGIQLSPTAYWVADSMRLTDRQYTPWLQPDDNRIIAFEPGPRPRFDAAIWAARVPARLPSRTGAPPTVLRATVVNRGTQPLAAGWQVFARLDSGAVRRITAPTALAPGDTAQVALPTPWDRAVYGPHRLLVRVATAAAQPDANFANDSLVATLHVASREVPRRVLQELATSSSCAPCAIYDDSLRMYDWRHPGQRVERIAYPMNFPGAGDPYYLPEFRTRALANLQGIRNIYLYQQLGTPLMISNGYFYVDATDRFTFPPMPPYDSLMQVLQAPPTYVALSGTCRVGGDTIRGAITLTPTRYLPGGSHTLRVVAVERSTRANATTNGHTEFFDVAKKIVLNRTLTAPLFPEQPLTVPYSYFFAPGHTVEHFDSLEIVAFVQYSQVQNTPVPSEVIQAVRLRPAQLPVGLAAVTPEALAWTVAPNPATRLATLTLALPVPAPVAVTLFDVLGRSVRTLPARALPAGSHTLPLDVRGLAPGVYVVQLTVGGRRLTRRLVVE